MANANVGAKLVAPVHPIDSVALGAWLRANVDAGIGDIVVEQYQGGQSNPTYRLTAGDRRYVLRRKPPGKLLPSAHAIDREFRVMSALAGTGVPVAKMHALCEDDAVIGTAFYVMEYVEGRILWDPTLPGMTPAQRAAHYDELNRVIATLHRVDYAAIGLGDFGRTGSYIERQVARWSKQYQAAGADRIDAMDRLIEWLPAHIPEGDETSVVHGDYRLDNVIFHPTEPRILAVLDWELSTLGHPLSDFALGIPSEADYVAAYCLRSGRERIANFEFYLIFNMFRIAAILHGVLSRALQGNAASADAVAMGSRARPVADVAWRMARNLN